MRSASTNVILGTDMIRQLVQVFFVLFRQDDALDARSSRRQDLLFDAANGNTRPVRVISPVIAVSLRAGQAV